MSVSTYSSRKNDVYEIILNHTKKYLSIHAYTALGIDATTLSLDLHMDRANLSRILNQLHQEDRLIKIQGRPTLFVAKDVVQEAAKGQYIPSIINKDKKIRDFIQTAAQAPDKPSIDLLASIIGSKKNESQYLAIKSINSAIYYPSGGLNILIQGNKFTDKRTMADLIQKQYSNLYEIKESHSALINCYNYSINEFINKISTDKTIERSNILTLLNIDSLVKASIERLQFMESNYFKTQKNSPFLIATSNLIFTGEIHTQLKTIFPVIVTLSDFDNKTIKEKIEYIMTKFQQEATATNHPISISTELLSCYAVAVYAANIQNLTNEIRYSISSAFYRSNFSSSIIHIGIEDLSPEVLQYNPNSQHHQLELEAIISCLDAKTLLFIPNTESKELKLLKSASLNADFSLNFDNNLCNTKTSITHFCEREIKYYKNEKAYPAPIIPNKKLLKCITDSIPSLAIVKHQNLLAGFVSHIAKSMNDFESGHYQIPYERTDQDIIKSDFYDYANSISSSLKEAFRIDTPPSELDYYAVFLQLSEHYLNSSEIPLLILCHGNHIAMDMCEYVNSSLNSAYFHYLNYTLTDQSHHFDQFQETIFKKINSIDRGNGVAIFTDMLPLTTLDSTIFTQTGIKTVTISPVSLPLLFKAANMTQNTFCILEDFLCLNQVTILPSYDFTHIQEESPNKLLLSIQNNILAESLVFLNGQKACQLLFEVLLSILNELEIHYNNEIMMRFVIHSCFTIERTIHGEPMKHRHTKQYIKKHEHEFLIVEKNFGIVNNTFGIHIPTCELAIITDLLLQTDW